MIISSSFGITLKLMQEVKSQDNKQNYKTRDLILY